LVSLALPAMMFFISSFVFCQIPIHNRMVECKQAALLKLDGILDDLQPRSPSDISDERQRQLRFYSAEIRRISAWPEWPFTIRNLSGVVGASLAAIAPQVLHLLLPLLLSSQRAFASTR